MPKKRNINPLLNNIGKCEWRFQWIGGLTYLIPPSLQSTRPIVTLQSIHGHLSPYRDHRKFHYSPLPMCLKSYWLPPLKVLSQASTIAISHVRPFSGILRFLQMGQSKAQWCKGDVLSCRQVFRYNCTIHSVLVPSLKWPPDAYWDPAIVMPFGRWLSILQWFFCKRRWSREVALSPDHHTWTMAAKLWYSDTFLECHAAVWGRLSGIARPFDADRTWGGTSTGLEVHSNSPKAMPFA